MTKYDVAARAIKVRILYQDSLRPMNNTSFPYEVGDVLKVYRVKVGYFPSGSKYEFLVWSKTRNKCVWVRDGRCEVVETAEEIVHHIR